MIPVTCYKLQGFFVFIKTRWKNFNLLFEVHTTTHYRVRKIPHSNLHTKKPEK